ncbi:MAG TPA: UvrD-helicase domain-containing protein [Armatimonadota bacterium]|jgi:DNA helicase-2/ATP-dependent DNA helicase PcrA
MPSILDSLNPAQSDAVQHFEGPLLIFAGAGSGKTRVLTHRIAHLVAHHGVRPWNILAVTFTNKAAGEMKARIEALVGESIAREMWVGTFHSICARLLRFDGEKNGIDSNFVVYDDADQISVVKQCLKEMGLSDNKSVQPRAVLSLIGKAKEKLVIPEEYSRHFGGSYMEDIAGSVYRMYQERLFASNALDFDDLIMQAVLLLKARPDVLEKYSERFRFVLVDEYQDINNPQYQLVKLLSSKHRNLCCVGDDDQCLASGTLVTMADGSVRPIEAIQVGDRVLSGYGSGDYRPATVTRVFSRQATGELVAINTEAGRRIVCTPEHMHFAGYRLGLAPQLYFTYLMYKKGVGYRLGTSQVYTRGQVKPFVGFHERAIQEHADALWIVGTHASENEAREAECVISLRYRLPTLPFVPRKGASRNGLVHDAEAIARVFAAFDTCDSAMRLLCDLGMSPGHPHHQPRSRSSNRRNVSVTLCGDHRGASPMHRIAIAGNDPQGRAAIESLGLSVRPAKSGSTSWRMESCYADYAQIEKIVCALRTVFDLNVLRSARMGPTEPGRATNSLPFTPAASVLPGMSLFTADGAYDTVTSVERVPANETVHDLDVTPTHNFVANGIVTHNSIYAFRGANVELILAFERDYPDAKVVKLEQNYRSTGNILAAAHAVVSKNRGRKEKKLWTSQDEGARIRVFAAHGEREEAMWVAERIMASRSSGRAWPDFAILYRTNAQSRVFEDVFMSYRIPYRIVGGLRFYERKEIKDIVAYLRLALNTNDSVSLRRIVNVPARGIGATSFGRIEEFAFKSGISLFDACARITEIEGVIPRTRTAIGSFVSVIRSLQQDAETMDVHDLVLRALDTTGYLTWLKEDKTAESGARVENLQELVTVTQEFQQRSDDASLRAFLEGISLMSDIDETVDEDDAVILMTLHSAKGLEFPVVFLVGMEEGLFPHMRSLDDPAGLEEERRLAYVGMTRAREELFLTYAYSRQVFGATQNNAVSRFIRDVPTELLDNARPDATMPAPWSGAPRTGPSLWEQMKNRNVTGPATRTVRPPSNSPYRVGQKVKHAKFGTGIVVAAQGEGDEAQVTVAFPDAGIRKLMLAYAKLETV